MTTAARKRNYKQGVSIYKDSQKFEEKYKINLENT